MITDTQKALSDLLANAQSLGEDWHEGVSIGEQYKWCCKAAGVLLGLSAAIESNTKETQ